MLEQQINKVRHRLWVRLPRGQLQMTGACNLSSELGERALREALSRR